MIVYALLAAYVAGVLTVLSALFLDRRRVRALAAPVGAVAIWMPFLILRSSLGLPSPFTKPGDYQILGSQLDARAERIYVLLDVFEGFTAPRLYSVPYRKDDDVLDPQFDTERNPYAYIGMGIHMGPEGTLNALGMPGEPQDLDKDVYYRNPAAYVVRPKQ